jgi:ABC-type spermidine/putrescine transport system permease subunit I
VLVNEGASPSTTVAAIMIAAITIIFVSTVIANIKNNYKNSAGYWNNNYQSLVTRPHIRNFFLNTLKYRKFD